MGLAMASTFRAETAFVRGCAEACASEIGFSPKAEEEMKLLGLFWPEIHQVLRGGRVVWSDKEADGARSIVVRTIYDGERLRLTVKWGCARYNILVASVERL